MKRVVKYIVMVMVMVFWAGYVFAGSGARVEVYARVMPMVSAQIISQPSVLSITSQDVERGYVEISGATVLRVRTNTPYIIYFDTQGRLFEEIEVSTGTVTASIVSSQGIVYEPYPGSVHTYTKVISYRFHLKDGVEPGVYPWPVQVGVEAN